MYKIKSEKAYLGKGRLNVSKAENQSLQISMDGFSLTKMKAFKVLKIPAYSICCVGLANNLTSKG